jgi:DNA topoisomerase I
VISYPRTSSQKLPLSIDYKKIITRLSEVNNNYRRLTAALLSKDRLLLNEGIKTGPAHPAIYPTGEKPVGYNQIECILKSMILLSDGSSRVSATQR